MKATAIWNVLHGGLAAVGGFLGWYLGGLDGLLYVLIAFTVVDYITGVLRAVVEKSLSSRIGSKGIVKKAAIFLVVGIAHLADVYLLGDGEALRTAVIFFYLAKKNNANAPELGAIFIEEGVVEGVRGDVAFCQSCLETGFFKFGGDVSASQNNFCGLGATGGGFKNGDTPNPGGASFATAREGVRAQIQHLKAYASKDALVNVCVDPRFKLVTRGIAPNWEDLNGRWAVPGTDYGQKILKLWESAKAVTVTPSTPTAPPPVAEFKPYLVKVTASVLNCRAGAGTNFKINGTVKKGEVYTIIGEAKGQGATLWGKLKSGAGWVSLDYAKKK